MASDPAHDAADESVEAFRREVREVYAAAEETARKALGGYLERFEGQDEEKRGLVSRGLLKEEDYEAWRRSKMLVGKRYRDVLDQVATAYAEANEVAMGALSGRLPEVYAENYNYGTYQVESAALVDTSFALQDASTVQRLLTDHGSYLPAPAVDEAKDKAWNRRLVANQITQGVLLGESMGKITRRIKAVTGSNTATATRAARTAVTAAENAGRVDGYRRAEGMGIGVRQEWLATLDGRTRHSHRALDGERVEVGGTFSNGCRYPGDPQAAYAETCNCRCTLVAAVDGVDTSDAARWARLPKGMSYEEWKAGKPAVNGAVPARRTIAEFMDMPGTARKLDAAGVSRTEARRALTEQLKEYGIPSQSFRNMSAGDQQKALDAALVRERGITSKRHRSYEAKVDKAYIRSSDYAAKFSRLDISKEAATSVRKAAVAMLEHRTGTDYEDLALISKSTGKIVARSSSSGSPLETERNDAVIKAIADHPRGDLISVHNHPSNIPPTGSDFASVGYNGYGGGVVALHNGEVFYYEVGDTPFMGESFDKKVQQIVKMGTSEYDAVIKVMESYERSHGIRWKKL